MDEPITLETAYGAHLICKARLLVVARQNLNQSATNILAEHRFELDKWLEGESELQYGQWTEFRKVVSAHRHYHFVILTVANLTERKISANFYNELIGNTSFARASSELGLSIKALKNAMKPYGAVCAVQNTKIRDHVKGGRNAEF